MNITDVLTYLGTIDLSNDGPGNQMSDQFCMDLGHWYINLKKKLENTGQHTLGWETQAMKRIVCKLIDAHVKKWEDYERKVNGAEREKK